MKLKKWCKHIEIYGLKNDQWYEFTEDLELRIDDWLICPLCKKQNPMLPKEGK